MVIEARNRSPLTECTAKDIKDSVERVFAQMLLGLSKGRLTIYHEPCVMTGLHEGRNCHTIPDFLIISQDPETGSIKEIYIEITGGYKIDSNSQLVDPVSKERQRAILRSNGVVHKILYHPQLANIQKKHPKYKFFPREKKYSGNGINKNGNGHNKHKN